MSDDFYLKIRKKGALSAYKISENPDSEVRAWLRNVDRKTTGFEMETAGAMSANENETTYYNDRNLGVLPIRALTDYGDPGKTSAGTEKYRTPGLQNALSVLKRLFETIPDLHKFLDHIYSRGRRA